MKVFRVTYVYAGSWTKPVIIQEGLLKAFLMERTDAPTSFSVEYLGEMLKEAKLDVNNSNA